MARLIKPLSPTEIKNAKPKEKEYTLSDGDGLLLLILPSGSKSWRFNYTRPITSKRTKIALGSYPEISLADARAKREEYRALIAKGIDPQQEKIRIQQENENRLKDTFRSVAESYFNGIYKEKAKNPETREKNWLRLENHIFPYIGDKHVSEIKVKELVTIYEKIADRSNTLKKLHQLVGAIMDHAITKGILESHNCRLAVKNFHIKSSTPHPTITPDELPKLFQDLENARIAKKTYLLICWSFLTALRPKEAVNAEWSEIDFTNKLWHIPKEKMKGQADKKRPHTVPLSSQAIQLLESMKMFSENSPFVFAGRSSINQPMNKATVNVTLKRIGYKDKLTAHGIRAFIKTFLASKKIDRNISESVLSHLLEGGDILENTYNRYDYLKERKPIMQLIGDYCESCGMNLNIN
ncbi:integrase arm-type DNA-binding domain-containing protein [Bisgaard Taxon 10/6]|uniref:tyrosine-type recombinase/integrase n=1 Tax=Exercitatus varius TaxID=67857 RepID=UPI00294AFAEA|nr:integrase arm-type DNA-binding domain-containing protein [Exercitatus varius]MDG2914722.1 integrase arm-type DNA-binding domain-containing protein [Exercitatus varius]MDG2917845.1 integrase arm-type DNA-binding domain-containing protein [Exercitatus varius]